MVICYDCGLLRKGIFLDFRPVERVWIYVKDVDTISKSPVPISITFAISPRRHGLAVLRCMSVSWVQGRPRALQKGVPRRTYVSG